MAQGEKMKAKVVKDALGNWSVSIYGYLLRVCSDDKTLAEAIANGINEKEELTKTANRNVVMNWLLFAMQIFFMWLFPAFRLVYAVLALLFLDLIHKWDRRRIKDGETMERRDKIIYDY